MGQMIDDALSGFSLYDSGKALIKSLWDGARGMVVQMVADLKARIADIVPAWMQRGFAWVSGDDGDPVSGNTVAIDSRPALAPDQISSSATDHSTTNITVHAAPGMNEQALAQETGRQVAQARSRGRSRRPLHDDSEDAQ